MPANSNNTTFGAMSRHSLRHLLPAFLLLLAILPYGCSDKKNDVVLGNEEMASLLADIHMAEAVVDLNHNEFNSDSSKVILRESIYRAHGITSEQFDSSLSWYGYHIEDYMAVYQRVQEILNQRQDDLLAASSERIIAEGDSVDIWPMSHRMEFSRHTPSEIVTFSIPADSNWRHNDVFTLRYNIASATTAPVGRIVVEYGNGTSAFSIAGGKNKGIAEVAVRIDSADNPLRISGYIMARPKDGETVLLDSISLIRMRAELSKRYFSQRRFNFGIKNPRKPYNDSIVPSATPADSAATAPASTPAVSVTPVSGSRAGESHSPRQPRPASRPASSSAPARQAPPSSGGSAAQQGKQQRDRLLQSTQRRSR